MTSMQAHIRSTGAGPAVLLLHSSGSSGRQWQPLMEQLAGRMHCVAVDLYGHGGTTAWPHERPLTLDDEVALLAPLLDRLGPVHLVGHSYGGAVALKTAARHPDRVLSVAVYEPVLFRLLLDYHPRNATTLDVLRVGTSIRNAIRRGATADAAERFVDYWSGAGTWSSLSSAQQPVIAARMPEVMRHFDALFGDGLQRTHLGRLDVPVLALTGARTRPPMRRLGELLALAMPQAIHRRVPDAGHMGPITQAADVNAQFGAFLDWQVQRTAARPTWLRAA